MEQGRERRKGFSPEGGAALAWMCILITAFPIKVAPKKVQKGTRKWPQVIPARSNRGFGICGVQRKEVQELQHTFGWTGTRQTLRF